MRLWAATHESVSGPMGGERGCSMASGARGCYPAVVRHGNGLARRERVEQDDGVLANGVGIAVQDDHRIAWAESGGGRRYHERRELNAMVRDESLSLELVPSTYVTSFDLLEVTPNVAGCRIPFHEGIKR